MDFEEGFGVKMDSRLPDQVKQFFYQKWHMMTTEGSPSYTSFDISNLMTRYEHFLIGSGTGMPPNPFKILRLYGANPQLEKVIDARRKVLPEGKRDRVIAADVNFPKFREITGIYASDCQVEFVTPRVEDDGMVQIPEVVAFYDFNRKRIDLSDVVLQQLQFPTINESDFKPKLRIREVFDYQGGYRIEMVSPS